MCSGRESVLRCASGMWLKPAVPEEVCGRGRFSYRGSNRNCMRILYIGQLREGQTALERMKILNGLGHVTVPFDTSCFSQGASRLLQSLAWRLNTGPILGRLNKTIVEVTAQLREISHIWVDKGIWLYRETLLALKQATGGRAVHFTLDSQVLFQRSRHFDASIPLYDVFVTTKEWEVDAYKQAGARRVILTYQGYDDRFYPREMGKSERIA